MSSPTCFGYKSGRLFPLHNSCSFDDICGSSCDVDGSLLDITTPYYCCKIPDFGRTRCLGPNGWIEVITEGTSVF